MYMPQSTSRAVAHEPIQNRKSFDAFLEMLVPKDRLNAQRYIDACMTQNDSRHAAVWKRLLTALGTLAPHAAKFSGQRGVQFYVADGKYRMQVFAVEDRQDGNLLIYASDPSKAKAGKGGEDKDGKREPRKQRVANSADFLNITPLDGSTPDLQPIFKDMVGWNRRAICISLPVHATDEQIEAAEALCVTSSSVWNSKS